MPDEPPFELSEPIYLRLDLEFDADGRTLHYDTDTRLARARLGAGIEAAVRAGSFRKGAYASLSSIGPMTATVFVRDQMGVQGSLHLPVEQIPRYFTHVRPPGVCALCGGRGYFPSNILDAVRAPCSCALPAKEETRPTAWAHLLESTL